MENNNYVLITGAGAGLGRCLALELAANGYNIVLASLHLHELEGVEREIKAGYTAAQVKLIEVDMLAPDAADKIDRWLVAEQIGLTGLVNNVGFGYTGYYEATDADFFSRLLQLNIIFTHSLTHKVAGRLIDNSPAFILNVASMAAIFPLPYKALYSASKAFVLTFSKALRAELRDRKVKVCCLCPGPMITNDSVKERIKNIGWRRHITNISTPEKIANVAINGVKRNKAVILPTFNDKLTVGIKSILPPAVLAALIRSLSKNSF